MTCAAVWYAKNISFPFQGFFFFSIIEYIPYHLSEPGRPTGIVKQELSRKFKKSDEVHSISLLECSNVHSNMYAVYDNDTRSFAPALYIHDIATKFRGFEKP